MIDNLTPFFENQDMILIDNCVLTQSSNLGERLYDIQTPTQLQACKDVLKQVHLDLLWRIKNLVFNEKTYTIDEVITELKEFEDHLARKHEWHRKTASQGWRNRIRLAQGAKRNRHRERVKKYRSKEFHLDMQEQDISRPLAYLDHILQDVQMMKRALKIYAGTRVELDIPPGAAETDYFLVGAALGYALDNEDKRVGILTADADIANILDLYLENNPKRRDELQQRIGVNLYFRQADPGYVRKGVSTAEAIQRIITEV